MKSRVTLRQYLGQPEPWSPARWAFAIVATLLACAFLSMGCAVEYTRTADGWRFDGWVWPLLLTIVLVICAVEARRK